MSVEVPNPKRAVTGTYAVLCFEDQGDLWLRCVAGTEGVLRERVHNELVAMMTEIDGDALQPGAVVGEMTLDRVGEFVTDWDVYDEYQTEGEI